MGKNRDYSSVLKDPEPKSIWDDDVDVDKLWALPPGKRYALFPDDFLPNGSLRGDF